MKVSLIALFSCCAVATSSFAAIDGTGEPAPRYTVADLYGVHPPRLNDLYGVHPPRLNDQAVIHPQRLTARQRTAVLQTRTR